MAEEIVTLGIEVKTDGVKQGTESLDKLAASGAKAEKSSAAMADSAAKANLQIAAMAQRAGAASASVDNLNRSLNSNTVSNLARDASASDKALSSIAGSSAKVNAQLGAMAQGASSAGNAINGINSSGLASVAKEAEKASVSISEIAGAARATTGGSFFSGLGAAATGAAGGLMAVAAAFGAVQLAQVAAAFSIKDTADELNKLSQRTGITVEKLSELRYAGELSDVSMSEFTSSFKGLANKMQEAAKGSGAAYEAFRAMKIEVTDGNKHLRATEDVLGDIADKFKSYNDGPAKAALATDVLTRSGEKLIPLLNQGRDGFRENAEEARKLGVVYSTELAKKAEELNDNMTRLKFSFEGTKLYLASEMMPTLAKLADQLVAGTTAAGGFFAALNAVGTLNPFKSNSDNLKSVQADIAKMEQDLKDYGYIDDQKFARKKAQLAYLKDMQIKEAVALGDGAYSNEGRGLVKPEVKTDAPVPEKELKPKKPKTIKEHASDEAKAYANTLQGLADIARDADASTLDLSASQKKLYDLMTSANWLKMPETWKQTAVAQFEAARAAELNAKFLKDVEAQQQKNLNARQSMLENIRLAEESATVFGLSAEQITSVTESRLADAIAMAKQNGATEDLLDPMREELSLLQQLGKAQEKNSIQALLANTEAAKKKQQDAKIALLDRALASGDISPEQHRQAVDSLSGAVNELGEFAKQAAHNMQDAMAEFFFDPFKAGTDGMVKQMGTAFQRMLANAAALQTNRLFFGNMDKDGQLGGLVGKLLGMLSPSSTAAAATGTPFSAADLAWLDTPMFHNGGVVGASNTASKMVPASLFNNAPRFHSGGIVGDEVPIIAKKGERVLTVEEQQAMGGMTINQTIYAGNGTDKSEVRRAAASGARAILNTANGARRYG